MALMILRSRAVVLAEMESFQPMLEKPETASPRSLGLSATGREQFGSGSSIQQRGRTIMENATRRRHLRAAIQGGLANCVLLAVGIGSLPAQTHSLDNA